MYTHSGRDKQSSISDFTPADKEVILGNLGAPFRHCFVTAKGGNVGTLAVSCLLEGGGWAPMGTLDLASPSPLSATAPISFVKVVPSGLDAEYEVSVTFYKS